MSNTRPIPRDKVDIAQCTAMAGEMLGLKTIYMDAGSGALHPITSAMISKVAAQVDVPLIVGGGIRDAREAERVIAAGADMIVVGNAVEQSPDLLMDISAVVHAYAGRPLV
jgi:putative glycerol-1-phosphate prenyltransferase